MKPQTRGEHHDAEMAADVDADWFLNELDFDKVVKRVEPEDDRINGSPRHGSPR